MNPEQDFHSQLLQAINDMRTSIQAMVSPLASVRQKSAAAQAEQMRQLQWQLNMLRTSDTPPPPGPPPNTETTSTITANPTQILNSTASMAPSNQGPSSSAQTNTTFSNITPRLADMSQGNQNFHAAPNRATGLYARMPPISQLAKKDMGVRLPGSPPEQVDYNFVDNLNPIGLADRSHLHKMFHMLNQWLVQEPDPSFQAVRQIMTILHDLQQYQASLGCSGF